MSGKGRRRVVSTVLVAVALVVVAIATWAILAPRAADDPDRLWGEAQFALGQDRIDEAARLLDRIAAVRTPQPEDWLLRGQLEIAWEDSDAAVESLARVPDDSRYAPTARLLAGQIELRRNRARFAEALLREAIRLDPGAVQARRELIYILGMQLRRKELNQQFAALSKVTTLQYENLFHWGLMRSCLWEPGEVAQTLGGYLEADPDDRESRLALADNDRRLGLYDVAEEVLAPLPDDDPRALALRVIILIDRHQEDQAEELLKQGPADDPELARLRGRSALARRDGAEALRCYEIAYADDPDNRDVVFGLIHAHQLLGQPEKAAALRREAEALEVFNSLIQRMSTPAGRGDPNIIEQAARACARAGFIPEARAWLNLAISRDPLDSAAQQALYHFNEQHPPGADGDFD